MCGSVSTHTCVCVCMCVCVCVCVCAHMCVCVFVHVWIYVFFIWNFFGACILPPHHPTTLPPPLHHVLWFGKCSFFFFFFLSNCCGLDYFYYSYCNKVRSVKKISKPMWAEWCEIDFDGQCSDRDLRFESIWTGAVSYTHLTLPTS